MKPSSLFDDMAKMAGGAAGAFSELGKEVERMVHAQMEQFCAKMQFVSREEFETVKAMAEKAREENEALKARIETLEK